MDAKKKNKIIVCGCGTEYHDYQTHIGCSWPNFTVLSCIDSDLPILALHIVHFALTIVPCTQHFYIDSYAFYWFLLDIAVMYVA